MSEKKEIKELNKEELEKVTGGKLTPEATDWYNKHKDTITKRLKEYYLKYYGNGMNALDATFMAMQVLTCENTATLDIQGAKNYLKSQGVNCDDLNWFLCTWRISMLLQLNGNNQ